MKRKELVKRLENDGFILERNGENHDICHRRKDAEVVPRHPEVNEHLAKAILKKWGL